ncbi:transcription factor GTE7 [Syzygium oleosum]|uniref:transcription factor GTE7 n=1 Tax=Syzygium oleosum TaxID=219896 RepID=UPI0011D1F1A8|nr:transcription factor GTE7 [Syzygium oleosum]
MASALLVSRIEPSWGDRKVYMRKYTAAAADNPLFNPNSNPNPNPNPNPRHVHDPANLRFRKDEDFAAAAAVDNDAASFAPRSRFDAASEYVTFNLGGFSRPQLKELKRRLVTELEQVRVLRTRIETAAAFEARPVYQTSQFSATRPSPEAATESPRLKDKGIAAKAHAGKKNSGIKRGTPFGSDKDPKRPVKDLVAAGPDKFVASMMKRCGLILTKIMKHKHGWVFNVPVDAVDLGLHDYHQIIKNPMDLGTVKTNLERNFYQSPQEFATDVRLTFNNALTYNPKGHDVHHMAETLLVQFDQMFDPALRKYEKERQKASAAAAAEEPKPRVWDEELVPESTTRRDPEVMLVEKKRNPSPKFNPPSALSNQEPLVTSPQVAQPAPVAVPGMKRAKSGKLPKPKAKDPNKRDMSFEEKAKLGMNLQNLPPEKMGQLLAIIRKRNKHFAQDGDEIELDIEAVDTETLWELDRFVCNYKKLASKIKRQGLIHNQVVASEITNKSPEREVTEAVVPHKGRRGEAGGEEDVDIGDEIPMSNYPPVEIERDARSNTSSSSSSSSDSSSSSGSDSRSSSGSDSEADSVQSPFVGSKGAHGT